MQMSEKKGQPFSDYGATILSSLASRDALKIFQASEKGIDSTKTIKELELTQKRYYTWLRKMMDAGLIEKSDGLYRQTLFGRILYESFFKLIEKSQSAGKGYEILNKLQNSDLDSDAKKTVSDALSKTGLIDLVYEGDTINSVRKIDSFERLIDEIIDRVERAEKCIYFASKYSDGRVAEALTRAVNRGVKANFITERKKLSDSLQMIRMALDPKMMMFVLKMIGSAKDFVRNVDSIPFSFAVLDEKWVTIELPNPLTDAFYIGFSFEDPVLAKRLIGSFKDLWMKGKQLSEDYGTEDKTGLHR